MNEDREATQTLFRPEALATLQRASLGGIQINTPLAFWVVSVLATSFIVAAVAYLYFGDYTRRATVDGMLVPATGLVTLSATAVGQVVQVDVRQGERVTAGQILAEFDNPLDSAAVGNTLQFIAAQLDGEKKGLREDLITQQSLSVSRAAALRASIASLRAQLLQTKAQLQLQRKEAASMSALLTSITPLFKENYVSVYELQQQQASTFNAELEVKALRRQQLEIQQQIASAEEQVRQLPLALAEQQNDTRNKLAEVAQALAHNEAQRAWVLRATRSGIVSTLLIKAGQAITTGQLLLTLLPAGSALEAQLLVPSSAIGFVRAGQRVVLRYTAFPYQKFGLYFGEVDQISRNALLPPEIALLAGQQSEVPLYRVSVRLGAQSVDAYGHPVELRPGMALQADILLDRRRLIEWVLEPLYGVTHRTVSAPVREQADRART